MQQDIVDQQNAAIARSYDRLGARGNSMRETEDDEDEVVEQDPEGRFSRYKQQVGSGRFKTVYRGFDEKRGVDVAWSKIEADDNHLTREQMHKIVEEMSTGLSLDHPHVIKSFQCWEDVQTGCINMVTEFFTSGNLRDYRRRHKNLDIKAMRKWARQILQGLAYLHQQEPVVVHGDLRADKIYINGHTGEIKIGDLGLSVLVPKRFAPGVMPEGDPSNQYTRAVDIFAFGLVVLELVTLKRMDKDNSGAWQNTLDSVSDVSAREFISKCLAPIEVRPTALELLKDPFVQVQKSPPHAGGAGSSSTAGVGTTGAGSNGSGAAAVPHSVGTTGGGATTGQQKVFNQQVPVDAAASATIGGVQQPLMSNGGVVQSGRGGDGDHSPGQGTAMQQPYKQVGGGGGGGDGGGDATTSPPPAPIGTSTPSRRSTEDQQRAECEAGSVRGEDYLFQFSGKIKDGKLHFRLNMHYEGEDYEGNPNAGTAENNTGRTSKTIDFVYDPEVDTPDEIAAEISSEFDLSPTDRDICAAALKEWLAEEGPDPQR